MQRQEERDCIIHIKEPELTAIINASPLRTPVCLCLSLPLSLIRSICFIGMNGSLILILAKKRGTEQQKVEMNRKISQCFKVWTASEYVFLETRAAVRPLVAGVIMTSAKEEVRWRSITSDDGWIKHSQTFTDEMLFVPRVTWPGSSGVITAIISFTETIKLWILQTNDRSTKKSWKNYESNINIRPACCSTPSAGWRTQNCVGLSKRRGHASLNLSLPDNQRKQI